MAATSSIASAQVRISQVYGAGGNSQAPLSHDYIEIYNAGPQQNLQGWAIQYAAATATSFTKTNLPNVVLGTGQYLLVEEATGGLTSPQVPDLPVADVAGTIAMSATDFKIALTSSLPTLTTGTPTYAGNPSLVDFVGVGTAANWNDSAAHGLVFSSAKNAPPASTAYAVFRRNCGVQDSGFSNEDWAVGFPAPRNQATSVNVGLTVIGSALPLTAKANQSVRLTASPFHCNSLDIAPGTTLTIDLSSIGGTSAVPMLDNATGGDEVAGDGLYTVVATIGAGTASGSKHLPLTVTTGPGILGQSYISIAVSPSSAPNNDNCSTATTIAAPSNTTGTFSGATVESNPFATFGATPISGMSARRGLWFRVIGTGDTLIASLCPTFPSLDSVVAVLAGSCDGLTVIATGDDAGPGCPGTAASASWCSVTGQEYFVWIAPSASGASTAAFTLSITVGAPCANGVVVATCTGTAGPFTETEPHYGMHNNDGCASTPNRFTNIAAPGASLLVLRGTARGMIGDRDVDAYRFLATDSGSLSLTLDALSAGAQAQLVSLGAAGLCPATNIASTPAPVSRCASGTQMVTASITAGVWYALVVTGGIGLQVTPATSVFGGQMPGGTTDQYTLNVSFVGIPPSNDDCFAATAIAGTGTFPYDNRFATPPSGAPASTCQANQSKDVWYAWTATATGPVMIDTCGGPTWDSVITIYAGPCAALTEIACDDDACVAPPAASSVVFNATAGTTYFVRIASSSTTPGATGSFHIACPDTDGDGTDDCADGCPLDPLKTAPGICGCGVSDVDTDGDGTPDCNDGCPTDPLKIAPGICGCGFFDVDTDGDGTADCNDGCPTDPAKIAPGICGCDVPDVDLNMDGIADCLVDVSQIAPCGYDNGIGDDDVGLVGVDGTLCWMQRFGAPGQTTLVSSVATAWGLAAFPATAPVNGTPAKVAVWSDPNGDGDPSDAVLVALKDTLVSDAGTNHLIATKLSTPVSMTGYFFIGASVAQNAFQAPGPLDRTHAPSQGRAWLAGNYPGPFDHANLLANVMPPRDVDQLGLAGVWLLRPDCGLELGPCETVVDLFDRDFTNADWVTTNLTPPAGPVTSVQVPFGGHPNKYRSVTLAAILPPSAAALTRVGGTYDPTADGAIQGIDWSVDARSISGAGLVGLYLKQAGSTAYSSALVATTGAWTSASGAGLQAAQFTVLSGAPISFACGAPAIEVGIFVGATVPGTTVGLDNLRVRIRGTRCTSGECCDEEALTNASGDPIYPPEVVEIPPSTDIDEDRGDVTSIYGAGVGDTVEWVQNIPCATLGGTVPPTASAPNLQSSLSSVGITGFTPQQIQDRVIEWENLIASNDLVGHVDTLPTAGPVQESPVWVAPTTPHIPDPSFCYAFDGRDIVFVHDLRFEHILDAQLAGCAANSGWTQPSTFPGDTDNPEYYGTGYFKASAEAAWAAHIDKFLQQHNLKNRYLIVSYSSNQRVDVAAHAILTQIADAMKSGTGVVDPTGNDDRDKFGTPSFVVVSQGLGSLVSDIALSAAATYGNLQASFIASQCKAHVALHGAFKGTRYVTAVLIAWGYLAANNPELAVEICAAIWTVQALAEILQLGCAPDFTLHCLITGPVITSTALLDMVPLIAEAKWSHYLDSVPAPTVTVAGGHPSMLSPLKNILAPGFDDGWVNVESQCAKKNLVVLWPSLIWPEDPMYIPNVAPVLYPLMFDMGTARTNPLRAVGLYVDQVADRIVTPAIVHLYHVASPATPWLSPTGMLERRKPEDPFCTGSHLCQPAGFAAMNRHPGHYNFIHSTADHFTGTNGHPFGFNGQSYSPTAFGLERNWEETIVISDPEMYQPYNHSGYPEDGAPLTRKQDLPTINEYVLGRTIRVPKLQGWKIVWVTKWIWKRTYHRPADSSDKHQCDYVYGSLLKGRPCGDTGVSFCFCDHGNGPCFPSVPNSGPPGRGCRNSLPGNPGALLTATGRADRSKDAAGIDPVILHATEMTSGTCLFFQGTTKLNGGNGVIFGDGLRCIGGNIVRLKTTLGSFTGAADFPGPGDPPLSVKGLIPFFGGIYHYQVWYRNAALWCTSATFNLTSAYTIAWAP